MHFSMTSMKIDLIIVIDHPKMTMYSIAFPQATESDQIQQRSSSPNQSIPKFPTARVVHYLKEDEAISKQTITINITATSLLLDETKLLQHFSE